MLGMFDLFPYLKGWEYKWHILERANVLVGATPIERAIHESGWLINIFVVTTDCYGTLTMEWQGAALETRAFDMYPELAMNLGAVVQDPAGWIQKYYRPNPYSTAGIYVAGGFTGGTQGSPWPYVPTVKMKLHLPKKSTQASAHIRGVAITIAITDRKAWLASLRKIQGIKGKIDPALLVIGPSPIEEES